MTPAELAQIFPLGPDSLKQPDVPVGRVEKCEFNSSRIYPGTVRDYWVYVPAQYRPTKAACVLVVQDGHDHLFAGRWNTAVVLDNLIHQKAMPVTIGVFINPGKIPPARAGGMTRDNRSFEYDSAGDRYARFVLEEILHVVAARFKLRTDGNSRAIMGGSSGGFCSLNAAWCRPDAFQRVVSMVGSFTPMRGGHSLAAQVRLTEAKPLKVFLQGGAQDLDVANGKWWTANLEMLSALQFAGYDVQHVWDERAGHNEFHCNMICPDALRWVWQDYPKKIVARGGANQPITRILAPQKKWRRILADRVKVGAITTDAKGTFYFVDTTAQTICRLEAGERVTVLAKAIPDVSALAVGDDGTVYMAQPKSKRVMRVRGFGRPKVHSAGVEVTGICAAKDGQLYATESTKHRVLRLAADGTVRVVTRAVQQPIVVRRSIDSSQLIIASARGNDAWLGRITPDGNLECVEPFMYFDRAIQRAHHRCDDLVVTRPGWTIAALEDGLMINNQNGLPSGFLPVASGSPTVLALGGPRGDQLFMVVEGKLHVRRIRLLPTLWL